MSASEKSLKTFNGPALLAAMFRELDPIFRAQLKQKLSSASPILSRLVDITDFRYMDLMRLDDASMHQALARIPETEWLLAWKLTLAPLREKILAAMSDRRRQSFLDMTLKSPRVHKAQVFRVQQKIARTVLAMVESGQLKLKSRRPIEEKQSRAIMLLKEMREKRLISNKTAK